MCGQIHRHEIILREVFCLLFLVGVTTHMLMVVVCGGGAWWWWCMVVVVLLHIHAHN